MQELPPEGFTIVSAVEFEMLSHLPEFERRGCGLVRVDDPEQFVFPQSEWDRIQEHRLRVEAECEALDASISTDAGLQLPKVATKPETKAERQKLPKVDAKPYGVRLNRFGGFEPFGDN